MRHHTHCFHDAYVVRETKDGPRQLEACCHCSTTREGSIRLVPWLRGPHGPYVPVKENGGTVPAGLAVNGG